ncbi:hypothetical protein HanRHA438_Chr04g0192801 [Helianthus annuus]|uniref:Uncharacterized protein n=1 Tax=Helianthus annuus TaxID=4232 RepID=A0A9K3NSV5_HELAN|nr:hypothetical protein HanXRQr2_Chr04g0183011 [Helianthus annuus]KAJ0590399.1 hypothetical protein HanIR_Chr04g0196981 [Helianthus annuus]KAJ0928324.1 hypothetical protein HanRHA438_Chr04g0192801 [Helianthus annuus]
MRVANWRSIRTRLSPHQLLVGLNTLSKQQLVAIKNMGFGSILKLKTDSLPAKMSHFVVDKFSGKDMVIKLNVGNIEVNEIVISGLLGLRNSGAVIEYKKKDKKNEEQKDEQKGKKKDKNSGDVIEFDVKEDEDEEESDMLYVDRTLCGDINTVRTLSPLSFWMKETLSRREKWEIKNSGFGKGELREGYVDTQVDVEHVMKEDRMKNVEQMVDECCVEKKNVTFEFVCG